MTYAVSISSPGFDGTYCYSSLDRALFELRAAIDHGDVALLTVWDHEDPALMYEDLEVWGLPPLVQG